MDMNALKKELQSYYFNEANAKAEAFRVHCEDVLNQKAGAEDSVYRLKTLQYQVIMEEFSPILFKNSPFYFETGTLAAISDGAWELRGHAHAGGWLIKKRRYLFGKNAPEAYDLIGKQKNELLYLVCGHFCDEYQHFSYNYRPIFEMGLKGVYQKAEERLKTASTKEEKEYLTCTMQGLLCLKKASEKFAIFASEALKGETDETAKANWARIAESAAYTPWNAPRNFYEALNTYAFIRKMAGSLEGVGMNTFGRIDMDLYPFYEKDIQEGRLTEENAYDLICNFLLLWDCHYDHDMKMEKYADHELENTYTLGGCDKDGKTVYNALTRMFLQATREHKIIFPKIKCRFSANSPKEYLDEINTDVIKGTSSILYCNDDAIIPALLKAGRTVEEARDYIETGCWGLVTNGYERMDGGSYVNLLKAFEISVHDRQDIIDKVKIDFKPFDEAQSFEEVYQITIENFRKLFVVRSQTIKQGKGINSLVNPAPIYSATLGDCIENAKDFTAGGAKYNDDHVLCVGFPNIVDSLLAIRKLCFETKKYSLKTLLQAVRQNWVGYEELHAEVLTCPFWGDGVASSCELAERLNQDLFDAVQDISTLWGGKTLLGHLTYTEIRWWGAQTKATPDGRRDGDYFSQGLTPSRLRYNPSVSNVLNSIRALDSSVWSANSVVNIMLPSNKTTLSVCEAFLRALAESHVQTLQLNCVSKEVLLDAQKHPENYRDLIIRVCGFSARFTALSPEWQDEVLSRNFYE